MRSPDPAVTSSQTAPDYDHDFFEWTQHTAALLRSGQLDAVDVEHLAEEVEEMGKRDRREVDSRLTVLLTHLLKWAYQPGGRSPSWRGSIVAQRDELERVLADSPSLRRWLDGAVERSYRSARSRAAADAGAFPAVCPWTAARLLDPGFLPE
jgi:hypothetical protein